MSIFQVEIVPVILEPHPFADSLSIVKIYNYTVCVRTEDWKDKSIGAYIPPDSVVPNGRNRHPAPSSSSNRPANSCYGIGMRV